MLAVDIAFEAALGQRQVRQGAAGVRSPRHHRIGMRGPIFSTCPVSRLVGTRIALVGPT